MLHDNDYLLDYIGQTKSNKLTDAIRKFVLEQPIKKCYNIPMSIIDVCAKDQNEILQLGASVPNDLILNGFGQWLNSWFGLPSTNDFINTAGTPINGVRVKQIGTTDFSDTFCIDRGIDFEPNPDEVSPCGTLFRLGSGNNAPARTNFDIQTPLNSAPESSFQNTGSGGFNSGLGKITIARTYPATGGTDTIREFGCYAQVAQKTSSFITMLTRDLVLPTVSYSPTQVINVELVWTLS